MAAAAVVVVRVPIENRARTNEAAHWHDAASSTTRRGTAKLLVKKTRDDRRRRPDLRLSFPRRSAPSL